MSYTCGFATGISWHPGKWLKGGLAEGLLALELLHLCDRLSPCNIVWSKFSTTRSANVSSLGPCIQHMFKLKIYFSPLKLSSYVMLIVYFFPSFFFLNPVTRMSCVTRLEENVPARGEREAHLPKAGKWEVGPSRRMEALCVVIAIVCWFKHSQQKKPHITM